MEYGPAPESRAFAQEWIDAHGPDFGHFIGGSWVPGSGHFDALSPADGKVLAHIAQGTGDEVDQAVSAARSALGPWQSLSGVERAKFLYAIGRQIQKNARLFSVLESLDNGKPIRETRDIDIPLAARHFTYHTGWAQLLDQEFAGYEPVGVCGQIIPWNFPLLMLSWKIAPALAAGNTVVLKPAEFTSLTALLFAQICERIGLPEGVVNIVTGDGSTGAAITAHQGVDKIAFTGSTEVGRIIRQTTAGSGKKLSLELGGKSPFVVFEDADLDAAVEGLVDAIWFNQGQVCCAGSRLLVQEGVAEQVFKKTKARMEKLRTGDPLDKAVDLGAIVDSVQLERISELVEDGRLEGAEVFQPSCELPSDGWFYPPTLLTNVAPASKVAQVEIFGPVLVAMTFRTPDEAVELANNTVFGLAASVWSENLNVAHDIAARIKAGTVWVNCTNQFDASSGFGGYRESGFGREGGREGLYEYLKPKAVAKTSRPAEAAKFEPVGAGGIDRTHKLYISGKQVRPDGGYSLDYGSHEVARGNRKDIRNAVEAATGASSSWASTTGHARSQILYYLAENLEAEHDSFLKLLGADEDREFRAAIERIMYWAGMADKYEGVVHQPPMRGIVYTLNEPLGVVGAICPEGNPLLGLVSTVMPLVALGNSVVCVPSEANPLPACELYRVLDASDVPPGVLNIVTGVHSEVVPTLVEHDGIDAIWHFGSDQVTADVERMSSGNLKQTWCAAIDSRDWFSAPNGEFARRATQVKNIWIPYGA